MSESNYIPDGTGVVMGDRKPMPDKGTTTGMTGYNAHLEGAGLGQDDTNSQGGISGDTGSDPADQCHATDPNFPAKRAKEDY